MTLCCVGVLSRCSSIMDINRIVVRVVQSFLLRHACGEKLIILNKCFHDNRVLWKYVFNIASMWLAHVGVLVFGGKK